LALLGEFSAQVARILVGFHTLHHLAWQQRLLNSLRLSPMMIRLASAINFLSLDNQEDGTVAGEGLSAVETFAYFFAAPTALFILISVITYALTGDRKKSKSSDSAITSIE
jgi:chromate transport protein ChrA